MSRQRSRDRAESWLAVIASTTVPVVRGAYGSQSELVAVALACAALALFTILSRIARDNVVATAKRLATWIAAAVSWWFLYDLVEAAWLRDCEIRAMASLWNALAGMFTGTALTYDGLCWVDVESGGLVFRPTIEKCLLVPVAGWAVVRIAVAAQSVGFDRARSETAILRSVAVPAIVVMALASTVLVAVHASVHEVHRVPGASVITLFHRVEVAIAAGAACAVLGGAFARRTQP